MGITGPLFLSKADAKSAFRILPLRISLWPWLVMFVVNPKMGRKQYFVDKCLPFGASISCALFQRFLNALCHVTYFRTCSPPKRITNYLDDFLFVAITLFRCNQMVKKFMEMCEEFSVPIANDKTEWGTVRLVFLDILMDGEFMICSIPEDKHNKAINLLKTMLEKKKATVQDLQSLCGYLNFLSKAIFPGRAFTRRMYSKFANVVNLKQGRNSGIDESQAVLLKSNFKLKRHHHVKLDQEFKVDCQVWLQFLTHHKLSKVVNRPMIDTLQFEWVYLWRR